VNLDDLVVNGIKVVPLIIGLVQFLKSMGVSGTKALRACFAGIGILLGLGAQISANGLPLGFAGWFGLVLYGIALGLVASGLVDAVSDAVKRGNGG
jgi:hypothetical protein